MSRKNGTEITFQEKFKDRTENMGKDGVVGIMKNTDNPINIVEIDKMKNWNNLYNELVNRGGNKQNEGHSSNSHNNSNMRVSNNDEKKSSKIGNSGQMIIGNNSKIGNNNNGMGNSAMDQMNPNYMMPYNQYMQYNPYMMGMNLQNTGNMANNMNNMHNMNNMNNMPNVNYNYPMMYNPYQMMGNPPINNYNRGLNYNNNTNSSTNVNVNNNQPIKLLGNNNYNYNTNTNNTTNNSNILPNIPEISNNNNNNSNRERDRAQRSKSSKYRSGNGNNSNNSINNANNYHDNNNNSYSRNNSLNNVENNNNTGPSTNPDSFSRKRGYSSSNTIDDGTYKPYTLKDYKDITTAKIVLGSLGANLGGKEWEERQQKLKKMDEYSLGLKQANRMILRLNKETPQERIEREKREKIKNSTRQKSSEYGKLVKPKPKTSVTSDANYSGLGIINENNEGRENNQYNNHDDGGENKMKFMMDYHNRENRNPTLNGNGNNNSNNPANYANNLNKNQIGLKSKSPLPNDNDSNRRYSGNAINDSNLNNSGITSDNNYTEIANMQKKREVYSMKINEIKESLLK